MTYISYLTQEQKRLYFSDFDAYFQNHQDLSPAETLYKYYSDECGYSAKEISQKTGRAYTTVQNTLQNAKKKETESEDCEILSSETKPSIQSQVEERKIVRPFTRSDLAADLIEKLTAAGISESNAAAYIRELTLGDLNRMAETNEILIPLKFLNQTD